MRPCGNFLAHRIAYTIGQHDPGNYEVLHRCDNPRCCNPAHLLQGTQRENVADMVRKGRGGSPPPDSAPRGTKHYNAKLTPADVVAIRAIGNTRTRTSIGYQFGVAAATVSDILFGKTWKHVA